MKLIAQTQRADRILAAKPLTFFRGRYVRNGVLGIQQIARKNRSGANLLIKQMRER